MFARSTNALCTKFIDIGVIELRQCAGANDPTEKGIGEEWISGQSGSVQVGADHLPGDNTLTLVAVTLTNLDVGEFRGFRTGDGSTGVVFEPTQWSKLNWVTVGNQTGIFCEEFPNGAGSFDTNRYAIKETQPGS